MKGSAMFAAIVAVMTLSPTARASEAETSAGAGSNSWRRTGTASASASFSGRAGFAQAETRSGPVNTAQALAVGVDRNGVSVSLSNAVAPRLGPAIATTFNLSINRNGGVSKSSGLSVSRGPVYRSASAGGGVSTGRHGNLAMAFASGKADRFGRVQATTQSRQHRPTRVVMVRRPALAEARRYQSCRR